MSHPEVYVLLVAALLDSPPAAVGDPLAPAVVVPALLGSPPAAVVPALLDSPPAAVVGHLLAVCLPLWGGC